MRKETLINFYHSYRLFVFPGVVALSSIFLIIFAIYPQTIKLINNQKASGDLAEKSKFLDSKVYALESINAEDLSQKLEIALGAFPSEKDFGNVLGLLQQLVNGSGFSISAISLGNSGAKIANADSFSVKLDVKGSKATLQNLLNNLENSPRLAKIGSIDVSSNQPSDAIDVSLSIDFFYSSSPKTAGSADSPIPQLTQKDEEVLIALSKIYAAVPKNISQSPRGKPNPFE